jgi:hypothetical protein
VRRNGLRPLRRTLRIFVRRSRTRFGNMHITKEIPTVMPRIVEAYKKSLGYTDGELAQLLVEFPDSFGSMYGERGAPPPRPKLTLIV